MSREEMWRCFSHAEMLWMNVMNILVLLYSCNTVVLSETVAISPSPLAIVEQYQPLKLYCSYSGNRETVRFVSWTLDDIKVATLLTERNETCSLFGGTLGDNLYQYSCEREFTWTIKNVTAERHAEKWSCEIITGFAILSSTSTSIFVHVSVTYVRITQPPGQAVTVEENQASTFTCATSVERPRSMIRWYMEDDKDHDNLLSGGSISPTNNDILTSTLGTITNSFKRNQNGSKIYCTASNTDGKTILLSNRILIYVQYDYGPSTVSLNTSFNTTVNENDGIAISCFADCYPSCIYRWKRDKTQLAKEVLVLDPIRRNDAGLYTCMVTNSANSSWTASSTVSINVRYEASVVEFVDILRPSENPTTLNEHERLTLVCTVDSYPGTSISISRLNNVLEHGVETNKLLLTLENVRCDDTGVYICSARNEYIGGSTESEQELQVFVRCPPRSIENSTTAVFSVVSQSVVLNVTVNAYPIPTSYSWYKEVHNEWILISPSNKVSISIERLQSSLRIDKLTVNDFGLYGVSAYNGLVGNLLIKRFFVYMEGSPGMPFGFTCRLVSAISKSVHVTWTPETDGGFEQTFHIQYKQDTKTEWTEVTVIEDQTTDTRNRSVIIKNLSPGLTYQIRMFARNAKGSSSITEEWTVSIPVSDIDKAQTTNTGALIGSSMGAFVAGALVSLLGLFLYWRFCRTNRTKESTVQGGKRGDGTDLYYNVNIETIKDVHEGKDKRDQQQKQSACTSGQTPNVYEELQSSREEQPYEQMKQDSTS